MSSDDSIAASRRGVLKCLAFGGAGTLFSLAGGVLAPLDLALAATKGRNPLGWGILGLFFSILTLIVVIVIPSKK